MIEIKVGLLNGNNDRIEILLPMEYDRLKEEIVKTENNLILELNQLDTEKFGELIYSVIDTDYKTLRVEDPTNIFYLNAYLQMLEFKGMSLPRKTSTYTSNTLKKEISKILELKKSALSLDNIYDCIYPVKESSKESRKPMEKPMFTIEGLRAKQKIINEEYRRKKYGRKN